MEGAEDRRGVAEQSGRGQRGSREGTAGCPEGRPGGSATCLEQRE